MSEALELGVLNLNAYSAKGGIGRVLFSLLEHWGERVHHREAQFVALPLPLLRNFPVATDPKNSEVVLLPQLTGAEALARTGNVPSVAIVHDVGIADFPDDRSGRSWLSQRKVMRSFHGLKHADKLVCVSNFCRERLEHHLPEVASNTQVIPNGVDDMFIRADSSQDARARAKQRLETKLQAPLRAPLLVYVGSEIKRKNIPLLFESLAILQQTHPDAQLLKVGRAGGDRWREATLDSMQACGLHVRQDVHILEDINDALLIDAYLAADVFVTPSLYEGFGLPALEAMAVGTPVVVSNQGALPEVVADAGWVVEPARDAFVSAIQAALEQGRDRYAAAAKARVAQFRWQDVADKYLEVLLALREQASQD